MKPGEHLAMGPKIGARSDKTKGHCAESSFFFLGALF